MNFIIWLWVKFNSFSTFKHKLLELTKFVEIGCVQVLGSMEDECYFFAMAFTKNKLNNHLICHLELCIWFYAQQILQNWQFFFWKDNHPMEKHKGMILPWSLNVNDLFMEVVSISLLCCLFYQVISFCTKLCCKLHNKHEYL